MKRVPVVVLALVALACTSAVAEEVDPASLYEVTAEASPPKVKIGEQGTFIVAIKTQGGAHVSDEAPTKIELSGNKVKLEKTKLGAKDSVAKKAAGQPWADPRFEVPFTAETAGSGGVDAKVTFFICTEKLCIRQQKALSVSIEVG